MTSPTASGQACPAGICVITAAYPSPSEPTRGIFIENLCRELAALPGPGGGPRYRLGVVAPRVHAGDPLRETRAGIDVRRFRYPSGGKRLKELGRIPYLALGVYLAAGLTTALREVRRLRASAIHAHWVLPAGTIGAMASRLSGVPLICHAHGSDIHRYALSSRPARALARWTLARAARVLAVSGELARTLTESLNVPAARVKDLPMGIDAAVFAAGSRDEARKRLGLNGRGLELLFVGDLLPAKGAAGLARALAEEGRGVPLRLNLAGDGPDRPLLEALSRSAPDRVRLLGRLAPHELAQWYRAADLCVLPSLGEGTPVSVQEALASGLPVMATAVGGLPDIVRPGLDGWLVPAGATPREFLQALERAAGDRGELERMRERLRAGGEDRSAARRARELAAVLEEVTGGESRA